MASLPPIILPRVGSLLRLLGSDQDGEALGAARALQRTLTGAGVDLHVLAEAVERPARAEVPTVERTSRRQRRAARPGDIDLGFAERRDVVEALRRGLIGDRMSEWESEFATSILERLKGGSGRLTERQGETLGRLLDKIGEGAIWG